ncbi:MAG: hypothetical protein NTX29_00645 [Actinobacteria bacterium]|nr:hypothetical protein [Actinomycetota bacterium]
MLAVDVTILPTVALGFLRLVTEVYLAACAMSLNATWVSFNRGFARFSGLTWSQPA